MADAKSKLAASLKLSASLKQAKTSSMAFVFVAKGTEGKLLVDKKKISPKDAADAKKECGGGIIYMGRCKGEEGKLVFEVAKEVPATLSALTKKIIKQDAGLTLDVEYRIASDLAAEDNQVESTGEGPKLAEELGKATAQAGDDAPLNLESAYNARLKALSDDLKKALTSGTAAGNEARLRFSEAQLFSRKKDFAQALALLKVVEEQIKKALATATDASGKKAEPANLEAQYQARVKALSDDLKKALTSGTAAGNEARLRFSEAQLFSRKKDFAQALALLKVVEEQIKKALATATAASGKEAKPTVDGNPAAAWERRVMALEPEVLKAQNTRAGDAKWMTMFTTAQDLGLEGQFAKSSAILDKLEELLHAPGTKPDAAQFARLWSTASESWQNASDIVDAQISQLQAALRAAGDKDLQEIAEFGLNGVTGNFKVPLMAAIREIDSAKGEALQPAIIKARRSVANFQQHLQGSEQVLVCDENPFNVKVTIRAALGQALTQMEQALGAGA